MVARRTRKKRTVHTQKVRENQSLVETVVRECRYYEFCPAVTTTISSMIMIYLQWVVCFARSATPNRHAEEPLPCFAVGLQIRRRTTAVRNMRSIVVAALLCATIAFLLLGKTRIVSLSKDLAPRTQAPVAMRVLRSPVGVS